MILTYIFKNLKIIINMNNIIILLCLNNMNIFYYIINISTKGNNNIK